MFDYSSQKKKGNATAAVVPRGLQHGVDVVFSVSWWRNSVFLRRSFFLSVPLRHILEIVSCFDGGFVIVNQDYVVVSKSFFCFLRCQNHEKDQQMNP